MSDRQHSPTEDLQDLRAVFGRGVDLTTSERVVLAVLILHRNGKTGRCDPSTYGMAEETGMNRRTVTRAIESLEERGLISCERRNGIRTTYTLHPPTGDIESPVTQSHRCQSVTRPGTQSHRTGDTVSPERTNTNEERTKERTREAFAVERFCAAVDADWRLSTPMDEWAEQLPDDYPDIPLVNEILKAAEWYEAKGRTLKAPDQALRNWLGKVEPKPNGGQPNITMTAEELREWEEDL